MKKYFLLIAAILITGCEKDFDGIIQSEQTEFSVNYVGEYGTVRFSAFDSLLTLQLWMENSSEIKSIFADVYSSSGDKINETPVYLKDNGDPTNGDPVANDNRFYNFVPLSRYYPVGQYEIQYYITDILDVTKLVAVGTFQFDNAQDNIAPQLSELNMPDTVSRGVPFIFTVQVVDNNGLSDIDSVYFELYRPDGSVVEPTPGNTKFFMDDTGNLTVFGDQLAGDGIYSFKNSFGETAQTGNWRFEFEALDRLNELSNKIIKNVFVE